MTSEKFEELMKEVDVLAKLGYAVEESPYYSKILKVVQEELLKFEEEVKQKRLAACENWKESYLQGEDFTALSASLQVRVMDRADSTKEQMSKLQEYKKTMREFVNSMMKDVLSYEQELRQQASAFFNKDVAGMNEDAEYAMCYLRDALKFKEQLLFSPFYVEPEEDKTKGLEPSGE